MALFDIIGVFFQMFVHCSYLPIGASETYFEAAALKWLLGAVNRASETYFEAAGLKWLLEALNKPSEAYFEAAGLKWLLEPLNRRCEPRWVDNC